MKNGYIVTFSLKIKGTKGRIN